MIHNEQRNKEIFKKWKQGWSYRKLVKHYGISIRAIWTVVQVRKNPRKCLDCGTFLHSLRSLRCTHCAFFGDRSTVWVGDNVKYDALHAWVARRLGKPDTCEYCGKSGLSGSKIHWANKSHKYLRDLNDWIRLCVSCHKKYDKNFTNSI